MPNNWNEEETRKRFIDKMLIQSGWGPIVEYADGQKYSLSAVEEYPTNSGPSDYILFSGSKPVAAMEGKKVAVGPQNVLRQAERYSRSLEDSPFQFNGYRVPFAYSTNGMVIWFRDLRHPLNLSREVARTHTPAALEELLTKDEETAKAWLKSNEVTLKPLRPYQKEAIENIEKSILDRKRKMLVAMATGTGKTFMVVNLIYRLIRSGFAKRILFLVDRRVLAVQAVREFASFEAEPGLKFDKIYEVYSQRFRREDLEEEPFDPLVLPGSYLTDPEPGLAYVYVSTIQRMRINLFGREGMFGRKAGDLEEEEDADKLDIPIHAFDLIIADECHRGYTSQEESKWREVLNHFDAVKVGLTATPASHTVSYFKEVAYRYDYERAVKEGYLVDYDAIAIRSEITVHGAFLQEGDEVGIRNTETGQLAFDTLEDERELPPETNETEWTAPDRNRKIAQELKKYLLEQEKERGYFPKTLIFADNDLPHTSHCDQFVEILREEFGRGEDFVQKITGSPTVDRPLEKIRSFRNRPEPAIVVTVDMLSTGVDVPRIENIVFMRAVKSRILFEQMLGRGTRLCDDIGKTHFTVFDCFGGTLLDYFRQTTAITAEPPDKPSRTIQQIVQDIADNKDRQYNIRVLSKRLLRISKNITAESRYEFNAFLKEDIADFARSLEGKLEKNWVGTIQMFQSDQFFSLCESYERPTRVFMIADSAEDIVETEVLFQARDGSSLKPEDYLQRFERFVLENPDHVEAIEILLNKPREFSTKELERLRRVLAERPDDLRDKFTERNLRRAYHNELADIISIIHHAARGEPLLTAEGRVDRALEKLRASRKFTREQEDWLTLIRRHLIDNLILEKEDFDIMPIFKRQGVTFQRLNEVFDGRLEELLLEINEAVLS